MGARGVSPRSTREDRMSVPHSLNLSEAPSVARPSCRCDVHNRSRSNAFSAITPDLDARSWVHSFKGVGIRITEGTAISFSWTWSVAIKVCVIFLIRSKMPNEDNVCMKTRVMLVKFYRGRTSRSTDVLVQNTCHAQIHLQTHRRYGHHNITWCCWQIV